MAENSELNIHLAELKQVAPAGRGHFFDGKGRLYFFEEGALWSLSDKDFKKTKVAGGGNRVLQTLGVKIPIGEVKFAYVGKTIPASACEVEEGVFWCVCGPSPNAILQIDTKKGEVEAMIVGTGVKDGGTGGFFGPGPNIGPNAKINIPHGPLFSSMGANGPQVFFYDYGRLRVADLSSRKVKAFEGGTRALFYDLSLIKPSPNNTFPELSSNVAGVNDPLMANVRIAWGVGAKSNATRLVDLDTGDYVTLSYARLHPLFPISSSMVVAVELAKNQAWIVTVDWSLPSDLVASTKLLTFSKARYELPSQRIKRVAQLPGTFEWDSSFLYDFSSNRLFCDTDSARGIICYSNIFSAWPSPTSSSSSSPARPALASSRSSSPNRVDIVATYLSNISIDESIRSFTSKRVDVVAGDLSKLLLPECPLPYDLQLTHSASNTSWNVHYDVLNHHEKLKTKKDVDRLATIIKYSSLPSASIFSFLKFLYFSPPADLTNAIESFMPLCHCIQLCNQVGLGTSHSNYILWLLDTKIVPNLPNEILLQNILTLWLLEQDPAPESIATYSKTSPLMSLLASRCRSHVNDDEFRGAIDSFAATKVGILQPASIGLCVSCSQFISRSSPEPLTPLTLSSSPPSMTVEPLMWDENLSVASRTPPEDKYTFVFTIAGRNTGGIVCNALLLYPLWRWFERLCQMKNCEEALTRYVVMPPEFTPPSLLAIITSCYGIYSSTQLQLTIADSTTIERHSKALHLPENPRFAELLEKCRKTILSAINDTNCLEKLHEHWTAGFNLDNPFFVDTLKLVSQNRAKLTLDSLSKLPLRLSILLGAYLDHSNIQSSMDDFLAIANALDRSLTSV